MLWLKWPLVTTGGVERGGSPPLLFYRPYSLLECVQNWIQLWDKCQYVMSLWTQQLHFPFPSVLKSFLKLILDFECILYLLKLNILFLFLLLRSWVTAVLHKNRTTIGEVVRLDLF